MYLDERVSSDITIFYYDEVWLHIISFLTYIEKINFSWTCKRFYKMICNDSQAVHVNENFLKMFHLPHDNFLEDLLHNFTLFFYHIYHYKCDRLYFANFKYQIRLHLSRRFIFGHAFWCQRKGILNCQCDKCTKTFQWHSESKDYLWYSRDYSDYFRL